MLILDFLQDFFGVTVAKSNVSSFFSPEKLNSLGGLGTRRWSEPPSPSGSEGDRGVHPLAYLPINPFSVSKANLMRSTCNGSSITC